MRNGFLFKSLLGGKVHVATKSEKNRGEGFVAVALLLMPVISCQSEVPVAISSALEEGVLCPDDITTFTCITRGTELVWRVNGITFRYGGTTDLDIVRRREGHMSMAHRTGLEESGMFLFTSVLYFNLTGVSDVEIECHNGRTSLQKTIPYRPLLPAIPFEPDVNASMVTTMIASKQVALLNITWTHDNSSGSTRHYQVEVGERRFVVQSTSLQLALPVGDSSATPTDVSVTAVDRCGRVSLAGTAELVVINIPTDRTTVTKNQGQQTCEPASSPTTEDSADVADSLRMSSSSSPNNFSSHSHMAKASVVAVTFSFIISTQF